MLEEINAVKKRNQVNTTRGELRVGGKGVEINVNWNGQGRHHWNGDV